jgi:hydroxyacylglutathione hydrolase
MISVKSFVFSPFDENTYVLYDETKECVIIDPGCFHRGEQEELATFIKENDLKPVKLLNTHCHLDHIFGNAFVMETYDVPLEIHRDELPVLNSFAASCARFGIPVKKVSPPPTAFLEDKDIVKFGNSELKTLLTPGHSPASISFFAEKERFVIGGDVLFHDSIGRTDLPGGNMQTLLGSIKKKFYPLGDDVVVYNGHGIPTTIGRERTQNPFLV